MFHFRNDGLKAPRCKSNTASISRSSESLALYHSGAAADRQIALTFDDGPSAWTAEILDVLKPRGVKATFFVMGKAIEGREEILRRLVAEGHELGNHLYGHADSRQLSDREVCREISATAELLARVGCGIPKLVRPPYGVDAARVSRLASQLGYGPTILWSIDPRDWCSEAVGITEMVIDQAHPGAIVLLHDGSAEKARDQEGRRETVLAVKKLLVALGDDGYSFATVSKVLQ